MLTTIQVKFAAKNRIPFLTTGGGHGFATTLGNLKNGIQLDLGQFKSIKIDKRAQTVTIGGAVRIGEVIGPLYDAGFELREL